MNSAEAAQAIGTDAPTLRKFLRSAASTFRAVGSGARYVFDDSDLPVLKRKFAAWEASLNKASNPPAKRAPHTTTKTPKTEVDREVWADEPEFVVPDVRDPRIRAMVRAQEIQAREALRELIDSRS